MGHDEVRKRAELWSHEDPFSDEINPSLLSKIEIERYAEKIGLIHPFFKNRLKTASYEGRIGERIFKYDEQGIRKELKSSDLKNGLLEIEANSIIFVESDITFHLPLYIALRFNLQILHVHRGLLLGTGPLIDPGYSGKILIPLHNLTSKPHYISINEGLIWIEFTKTTYNLKNDSLNQIKFPEYKKNQNTEYWINKAAKSLLDNTSVPIQSSIPSALLNAELSGEIAKNTEKKLHAYVKWGVIGTLIAAYAIFITFFQNTYEHVDETRKHSEKKLSDFENIIDSMKIDIKKIQAQNDLILKKHHSEINSNEN